MSVSFLPCSDLTCSPLPCSPLTWSPLPCSPLPCSINSYFDSFREKEVVEEQAPSNKTLSERVVVKGTKTYPNGTYEGEFVDGLREGFGRFTFFNGSVFEGQYSNDRENGKGIFICNDGERFEGSFKDNQYNGYGTIYYPNGSRYEGSFVNGLRHGQGVMNYVDGVCYKGAFEKGGCHGEGVMYFANKDYCQGTFEDNSILGEAIFIFANGDRYEGTFKNGLFHGKGIMKFTDGRRYEGNFENGRFHGKGVFKSVNGNSYEGNFENGQAHGKGMLKYADGSRYNGNFEKGLPHGNGIFNYANGDRYVGDLEKGLRHGKGIHKTVHGDCYDGTFEKGLVHGQMKFTNKYGKSMEGIWQESKFIGGLSHLSDPLFLGLLLDKKGENSSSPATYPLSILSDFLLRNNYTDLGNALVSAHATISGNEQQASSNAQIILQNLKRSQPQLLYFDCLAHSMGLKIIPTSTHMIFEVYNSGDGLATRSSDGEIFARHKKDPSNYRKWQTKWARKVSASSVTPEILEKLLLGKFANVDEAYAWIEKIPGENIEQDPQSAVWQTEQTAGNCSIEWIFAYLRNNMSKVDYDWMRIQLFQKCLENIKDKSGPEIEAYRTELNRKIKKRMERSPRREPIRGTGRRRPSQCLTSLHLRYK